MLLTVATMLFLGEFTVVNKMPKTAACKCGETCPCVRQTAEPQPIRLRCTDGSIVERTATGWRLVGTVKESLTVGASAPASTGCRVVNGVMVCPQKR